MHKVLKEVARYALISQVASVMEGRGEYVSDDICLTIPCMVPRFSDWIEQVHPELSVLTTDTWADWLNTGYAVYGEDLAIEIFHAVTGSGGAKEDGCTQYVREGCMPYLPDLGYLVACCCCE